MKYTIPIKIDGEYVGSFAADIHVFEMYVKKLIDFSLSYEDTREGIIPISFDMIVRNETNLGVKK